MVGHIEFFISMWDSGFRCWADKGLYTLNQLFNGTDLKSFSQLQKQFFTLPSSDLHRYLQIRHYIMTHKEKEMICKMPNAIEEYLINILEKCFPTRKDVSNIYKRLEAHTSQNTLYIKEKWELELNIIIEHDVWDLCVNCHKGVSSQLWEEFNWK